MTKHISEYEYSMLKDIMSVSSYEETMPDGKIREIDKTFSKDKGGSAEYIYNDIDNSASYDNIGKDEIPLDIVKEMTLGESPIAERLDESKDVCIDNIMVNNNEFNIMLSCKPCDMITYKKYKLCDTTYVFKNEDKDIFKPGALIVGPSKEDKNKFSGMLDFVYDEEDPYPALTWADVKFDTMKTDYLRTVFALSSYGVPVQNKGPVKYIRDKYGFVEDCEGIEYYCAKYIDQALDGTNNAMTVRSIYSVPFILTLNGLYVAKDDHVFMITELAEIDLDNGNIVTYFKQDIEYTELDNYNSIIKDSKRLDADFTFEKGKDKK